MGRKTHGPPLIHAIEQNNQKKVHEILMLEIRSKKKIKEMCTAHCKRPGSDHYACPLLVAASLPDPGLVKYMVVKHEANVNFVYKESNGKVVKMNTALKVSVKGGVYHVVEVLLGLNADPNIPDHKGRSVLFYAVQNADYRMAKMLLSRGAKVNLADNAGNTPLHMATRYGHLELVKLFVKYGGDLYKKGPDGAIPIHIASKEGHTLLVRYFAQQEVNVNIKVPCYDDGKERAPLHVASEEGHSNLVQCLLFELSAHVDIKDSEGETPLHCTVIREYDPFGMKSKEDYAECSKALLKHGANCSIKNLRGETPLHLAARNEFQRVAELLVDHGANPSIKDNDGNKPIDLVSENDTVSENLLKDALNNLERKTSQALEVNARGYSTAIHRPKSAADIIDDPFDGSMGRTASVPGLFVSTGSDKRLNGTLQGIYKDGYLEPLGSRNTINDHDFDEVNDYEAIDESKKDRRKRINSEIRRSREMMLESSSDSYQHEEQRSFSVQRSKSMDLDVDESKVNPHNVGLPKTPQPVRKMMPELNQVIAARNAPQLNGPVSGSLPNHGNQHLPHPMQRPNASYNQQQYHMPNPNVPNQDRNNNFNKNQQISTNKTVNASSPVKIEPPVNYFQNTEPIEPIGQYNISIGPPKPISVPGSPGVRRAAVGNNTQQQQHINGSIPRGTNLQRTLPAQQPQPAQRHVQPKIIIPLQQVQNQQLLRVQQGTNPVSDSDDTFFDDASFDTMSEDNLDEIKKGVPRIQHIVEPKTPTESQMVPVRIGSARGDPKLMQSWLAEQARLIHKDGNAPVAQSSPQLGRHNIDEESVTTVSQSDGDFDRRITITLQPEQGGQQQVTINTAELAKKHKPKPPVKPRKSKSHTPPPQIPSRDTKPLSSFRGRKPVVVPPEVGTIRNEQQTEQDTTHDSSGKLQWERVDVNSDNSLYWEHTGTEDVYESIRDNYKELAEDDRNAYMAMNKAPTEDKSISVQSLDQLQNGDISHDLSSPYTQADSVQQIHPPPSPASPQRRNSKSRPVAIPTVPGNEGQQNNRNSQTSMVSVDSMRSSRASVSSINTVIYVPNEKENNTTLKRQEPAENKNRIDSGKSVKPSNPIKQSPNKNQPGKVQTEQTQHNVKPQQGKTLKEETQYEELSNDLKKKVSIGHEEVFQETENTDPDMRVITYDTGDEMQLVIVGGNAEGIFVHRTVPDSEAEKEGLQEGDQIFKVNGVSLKGKTQEEAYFILMAANGKVTLHVVDKEDKYERVMHEGGAGDSFNIRSSVDFEGGDGEISFVKGEIVCVKDTMPNGKIGSWVATKLYARNNEVKTGLMPNEERAEQIAKAHAQSETIEKEERGGFLRRSLRKSKSSKDKRKERTLSVSSVQLEGPIYERVDQRFPGFIRPVVLLGLFCDAVRERLVTELPEKYEMPPPEAELVIRDTMDYVEKHRILDGQHSAIKRVIGRRKHCLLVVSPKSVQQFIDWDLHPMVIFMSVESKNIVKSLKPKMSPNLEKKPSSLYEDSLHFARDFSHIFTVTVPYTTDDSWYTLMKDSIGRIQNLAVWQRVDEHDGEEKLETTEVRTVTTTNSSGQQRVIHYVQQGNVSPQKQNGPGGTHDEPDRPDLGVTRPIQTQGPPMQPVRPQALRPRHPMQYPQQPYPYNMQQQYYYPPHQGQMYQQQQQNWMQQQQQQQLRQLHHGSMERMHQQVNITGYMGGQPRTILKESRSSPTISTDSTSTTGRQQQNQPLQGQYMAPYQHMQTTTSPPRQVAPQSVNTPTQYAVIQKNASHQPKETTM